ncbi:MAG: GGDEF domain-containing protein [Minisyncoccia bacterium]
MSEQDLHKQIVDLKKQIHDLEKDLIHDVVTGLKTRSFFDEECDVYLSALANLNQGKRREWFGFKNLSILFFDIDHFKKVNDTYGHEVGDKVLEKVSETIVGSVRDGDTVARWGGEEIVAMLLGANEKDARAKAEEIREKIKNLIFDIPDLKITISIGVATNFKDSTRSILLKNADLALYNAKRTGRNKVVTFSELK